MTKRRIFISHRRVDQKVSPTARMIANLLKKKIVNQVFLDVDSTYVRQFPDRLKEEIEKCHIFILVLPDNGDLSFLQEEGNWVRREIEYALRCKKPILPIITKQDFHWPKDLPESIKDLSHNQEGIFGGLNILFYDTNEESPSIKKLHDTIDKIMHITLPQYILSLKSTKIGIAVVIILLLFLSWYKAYYPHTDKQAQALFQTANEQSAKNDFSSAMDNYQKVMKYYEDKTHGTEYFHSKFMYGEFSRQLGKLSIPELIALFKSLKEETESSQSTERIQDIGKKSCYWVGYFYDKQENADSCIFYYNDVKDYFRMYKDDPMNRYVNIQTAFEKYLQKPYEKAIISLNHQDSVQAMEILTKIAKQGYAPAQYQLASCFINKKEYDKAAYWNEQAAKQGYAPAQYDLGVHYFRNNLHKQAAQWFQKAATNENNPSREAMKQLSVYYRNGWGGLDKDEKKADEWLQKAHE